MSPPARRITVALYGQPFWTRRLARSIGRHSATLQVTDLGGSGLRALPRLPPAARSASVVSVRVGYRPGAATPRGRGFDACWWALRRLRPSMATAYYWIGSDVASAVADAAAGRHTGAFASARDRSAHCAGAPWLTEELATIGVEAQAIPFPVAVPALATPPAFPARFSVLTYIPDARPRLYGGDCLLAAAAALPEVRFVVAGGSGTWAPDAPANVSFAGWLPSLTPAITDSQVVMRLVRHDGFGATVREALALGRHALYSYPVRGAVHVDPTRPETVIAPLRDLWERHGRGALTSNEDGRRSIAEDLDEGRCVARFEGWVQRVADAAP